MTRVLHVVSAFDGGELRQIARVAAELTPRGGEFQTIALVGRDATDAALGEPTSLTLRRLPVSPGFDSRGLRELRTAVDDLDPEIIHAVGDRAARDAAWATRTPRRLVVGSAIGGAPRSWWKQWLQRSSEARADAVVAASESERERLPGHLRARARVIPPGVAANPRDESFRTALLEQLGLPADTKLLGTAGPLVGEARVKDLIWAADLLKCVRDDVHLLVLGEGPQRWRLERYRRQVEITDRVHLLGRRADEPAVLASLDCFWLGAGERLSTALLEAMAAGVPVVVADTPVHRELITPEQTGCLTSPGDRAALARRTQALLENSSLARDMGDAGRRMVEERFPLSAMIERYAALYDLAGETTSS